HVSQVLAPRDPPEHHPSSPRVPSARVERPSGTPSEFATCPECSRRETLRNTVRVHHMCRVLAPGDPPKHRPSSPRVPSARAERPSDTPSEFTTCPECSPRETLRDAFRVHLVSRDTCAGRPPPGTLRVRHVSRE